MTSRAGPTDEGRKLAREPWAWRKAVLASPYTVGVKLGGIAIAEFVNKKTAISFAYFATVGESCGIAERTIRHAYDVLSKGGFFKKVRRRFRGPIEIQLALPEPGVTVTRMTGKAKPKAARRCQSKRHDDAKVSGTAMTENLNLLTEPSNEPSTKSDASLGEEKVVDRTETAVDHDYLPGITYRDVEAPPDGWPSGLTRQGCDEHDQLVFIYRAARPALQIPFECSRIDGTYVDNWVLAQIPEIAFTEMKKRCEAGKLTNKAVAMAVRALRIPQWPEVSHRASMSKPINPH